MPNIDIPDQKKAERLRLISRLNGLSPGEKPNLDREILQRLQTLPELQAARHIFSYVSVRHETDTHAFINWLIQAGKKVSIPSIHNNQMNHARFQGWTELQTNVFGIPEPRVLETITTPIDITITPGTGFSATGHRLGMGMGYYDQWFLKNAVSLKIGLAYEVQIVDELPTEEHDVKMDIILTEKRTIRV